MRYLILIFSLLVYSFQGNTQCSYDLELNGGHFCNDSNAPSEYYFVQYLGGGQIGDSVQIDIFDSNNDLLINSQITLTGSGSVLSPGDYFDLGIVNGLSLAEDFSANFYVCDSLIETEYYTSACYNCLDGIQNGDEEGVDCGGLYCEPCDQSMANGPQIIEFPNGAVIDNGCRTPDGSPDPNEGITIPLSWHSLTGATSYEIILTNVGASFPLLNRITSDTTAESSCLNCFTLSTSVSFKVRALVNGVWTAYTEHIGTYEPEGTDCINSNCISSADIDVVIDSYCNEFSDESFYLIQSFTGGVDGDVIEVSYGTTSTGLTNSFTSAPLMNQASTGSGTILGSFFFNNASTQDDVILTLSDCDSTFFSTTISNICAKEEAHCEDVFSCLPQGNLMGPEFGSFDDGTLSDWQVIDCPIPYDPARVQIGTYQTPFFDVLSPKSHEESDGYFLNGFDGGGPCTIEMFQDLKIPEGAKHIAWDQWIAYDLINFNANIDRFFEVHLQEIGGGAILDTLYQFTAQAQSMQNGTGWISKSASIEGFAGDSVRIVFCEFIPEYFSGPAALALDNISILDDVFIYELVSSELQMIPQSEFDAYFIDHCNEIFSNEFFSVEQHVECHNQGQTVYNFNYLDTLENPVQCQGDLWVTDPLDLCAPAPTVCEENTDADFALNTNCVNPNNGDIQLLLSLNSGGSPFELFRLNISYSDTMIQGIPFSLPDSTLLAGNTDIVVFNSNFSTNFSDSIFVDITKCNSVLQSFVVPSPCPTPTCNDMIQNGQETGIDCGGPECPPCDSTGVCDFVGAWTNVSEIDFSIPYFTIDIQADQLANRSYGSCFPVDCDWGNSYTSIEDQGDCELTFYWNQGFAEIFDTIYMIDENNLMRTTRHVFLDESGRSDLIITEFFIRTFCDDEVKNGNEEGIDCGGTFCVPCVTDCSILNLEVESIECQMIDNIETQFANVRVRYEQTGIFEQIRIDLYGNGINLSDIRLLSIQEDTVDMIIPIAGLPIDNNLYTVSAILTDYNDQVECHSITGFQNYEVCESSSDLCSGYISWQHDECGRKSYSNQFYVNTELSAYLEAPDGLYSITVNDSTYTDVCGGGGFQELEAVFAPDFKKKLIQKNQQLCSFEYDLSILGADLSSPGIYEFTISSISSNDGSCIASDSIITTYLEIVDYPVINYTPNCSPDGMVSVDLTYGGYGGVYGESIHGDISINGFPMFAANGVVPLEEIADSGAFMGTVTLPLSDIPLVNGDSITIEFRDFCSTNEVYSSYSFVYNCASDICDAELELVPFCDPTDIDGVQIYVGDSLSSITLNNSNQFDDFELLTGLGLFAFPDSVLPTPTLPLKDIIDVSLVGSTQNIILRSISNDSTSCTLGETLDTVEVEIVDYPGFYFNTLCDTSGSVILQSFYNGFGGIQSQDVFFEIYTQEGDLVHVVPDVIPIINNDGIPHQFVDAALPLQESTDSLRIDVRNCFGQELTDSYKIENVCAEQPNPCAAIFDMVLTCDNDVPEFNLSYSGQGVPGHIVYGYFLGSEGDTIQTIEYATAIESQDIFTGMLDFTPLPGEQVVFKLRLCDEVTVTYILTSPCIDNTVICQADISLMSSCNDRLYAQQFYVGEEVFVNLINTNFSGDVTATILGNSVSLIQPSGYPLNDFLDLSSPVIIPVEISDLDVENEVCEFMLDIIDTAYLEMVNLPVFSINTVCNDTLLNVDILLESGGIRESEFYAEFRRNDPSLNDTLFFSIPNNLNSTTAILLGSLNNMNLEIGEVIEVDIYHPCIGVIETFEIVNTCKVLGCTDVNAHNYDRLATNDAGCETCDDGIMNGDETEVDCGGDLCLPCEPIHDFSLANLSMSQFEYDAGERIDLIGLLHYNGNSSNTIYPEVGIYLSTDPSLGQSDILIGTESEGVNINSSVVLIESDAVIPSDMASGTYYLLIMADHDSAIDETDEGNNLELFVVTINGVTEGDDIVVTNPNISASTLQQGQPFTISGIHEYIGTNDALLSTRLGFYLSTDDQLQDEDIELGDNGSTLSAIFPTESESANLMIPSDVLAGDAFILLVADHEDDIEEIDENNNVVALPITISDAPLNNFYAINPNINGSSQPTTLQGGESYTLSISQYTDQPDAPNRIWVQLGYYISSDPFFSPDTDYFLGKDQSSLADGDDFDNERINASIPASFVSGDYYILFVADYTQEYPETNETDNVASIPVTINTSFSSIIDDSFEPLSRTVASEIGLIVSLVSPVIKDPIGAGIQNNKLAIAKSVPDWQVKIFPNPTSGIIKIETNLSLDIASEILVYDWTGRLVKKESTSTLNRYELDLTNQLAGTYTVQIRTKSEVKNMKIILIN